METTCGIYKITNKINGKCYIGKSVDIHHRWISHKSDSRLIEEGGDIYTIHCAIRKYGIENFSFEIIEKTLPSKLEEREKYWIKYYNSYYNGYNETLGGDGALKYNYEEIVNLWKQGLNNKEIREKLHCDDKTVTAAFRAYEITEKEVRSRSNCCQNKKIVAIDIITGKSLKVFNNSWDACKFLTGNLKEKASINNVIKHHYRWQGYYWDYLTENNQPEKELSDEDFLKYRQEKLFTKSKEMKERISISNRYVERCSREELKNLIRNTPFTTIGKMFGVTDNAIRKWCDYYNLPRRVKDIKVISDEDWINI